MFPIQITMKDILVSPALEILIRKRSNKLSRFYNHISSCRVVIDLPQKHKHQGKLYNVRIDITVPGKELVVTHKQNENVYVAVRDAFDALERQLEEYSRKRHGRVKTHEAMMHGHVVRMLQDKGYGFIEGADGHEYYFSMTNVSHPNFTQLCVGDSVAYISEAQNSGADGRQAQRVIKEKHSYIEY